MHSIRKRQTMGYLIVSPCWYRTGRRHHSLELHRSASQEHWQDFCSALHTDSPWISKRQGLYSPCSEAQQWHSSCRTKYRKTFFVLVFMGYRTIIMRYVAKWGIAQLCWCETKCPKGIAWFWGECHPPLQGIAAIWSIAISRDMGSLCLHGCVTSADSYGKLWKRKVVNPMISMNDGCVFCLWDVSRE